MVKKVRGQIIDETVGNQSALGGAVSSDFRQRSREQSSFRRLGQTLSKSISEPLNEAFSKASQQQTNALANTLENTTVQEETTSLATALSGPFAPIVSLLDDVIDFKSVAQKLGMRIREGNETNEKDNEQLNQGLSDLKDQVGTPDEPETVVGKLEEINESIQNLDKTVSDQEGSGGGRVGILRGLLGGSTGLLGGLAAGGLVSSVAGVLAKSLGGLLSSAVGLLVKGGAALLKFALPAVAVAGAGVLGFKLGEILNDKIEEFLTEIFGEPTTLGALAFDAVQNAKIFRDDLIRKTSQLVDDNIVKPIQAFVGRIEDFATDISRRFSEKLDDASEAISSRIERVRDFLGFGDDESEQESQARLRQQSNAAFGRQDPFTSIIPPGFTSGNVNSRGERPLPIIVKQEDSTMNSDILNSINSNLVELNRKQSIQNNIQQPTPKPNISDIPLKNDDLGLNMVGMGLFN